MATVEKNGLRGFPVVARQLPAELASDFDDEDVGEEIGPVLESGEGFDECSALDTEIELPATEATQIEFFNFIYIHTH